MSTEQEQPHAAAAEATNAMDTTAAGAEPVAASSSDAAAEPAAASDAAAAESSSSSAAAAADAAAVPSSSAAAAASGSLADLEDDEVDEMAMEAIAERNAQEEAAAAAEEGAGAAETDAADANAGDTAMDDAAAAADEGAEPADADDPAADLESRMLSACRSILASLSLSQVQKSSKSHMLDKLKGIMGKKVIKRNKEMATRVARQAAAERLAELEKGGEDAAAAAAAEDDARPLAAYADAEEEDDDDAEGEEEAPKKKTGKKRLRKSAGSDAEDDPDDDGDYAEGAGSSAKKKKAKKSSSKKAAAAAASSEPASSTVAMLAFEAPKTPYQIFQSLERRSMKDEHPDASPAELSRLINAKWNELDEDAKAEFEALARKQKTDHAADLQRLRDEDPAAYEKHMKAVRKREEEALLGPGGKKKKGGGAGAHDDDGADPDHPLPAVEQSYFDSIISDLKPKKKTKKDYSSDEMIAQMREKEQAFIDKMINVARLDEAAAEAGKPAVHKLKMLPDVQAQLSKREVADRMMDSGLLRALCMWIAPEADGSLPNVRLRTVVYQILGTLRVTETSLASSQGLGKRIMRLWKDPSELLSNKRILSELMEKWMRPMLGLSTDYAKASELEEERAQDIFRRKAIIDAAPKAPNYNPKRARIPEPARFDYAIRPQAANERESHEEAIEVGGGKPKKEETRKQQMHKRLDKMGKSGSIAKPRFKVDVSGRASNM